MQKLLWLKEFNTYRNGEQREEFRRQTDNLTEKLELVEDQLKNPKLTDEAKKNIEEEKKKMTEALGLLKAQIKDIDSAIEENGVKYIEVHDTMMSMKRFMK